MKTFVFAGMLIVNLVLLSCGGDDEPEPYPDITGLKSDITELEADIDKKFEALQADIKGLQTSIAQGTPPPVIEGAVPVEIKDPIEEVQETTGGLPPTGEPTGKPVANPINGVPVFGDGRIVFARGNGIHIMGSNGGGVELVVEPEQGFRDPALSPGKESVAYSGFDGDPILVVRHIESGAAFSIKPPGGGWFVFPSWSPDGKQLAYSDGSNIFTVTVDPINPQFVQITHHSTGNETPSWSPDGTKIAFASNLDGNANIFTIGIDGRDQIRITNHPGPDTHPDWSPNGEQIAFMGNRDERWGIYMVNVHTFVETHLVEGVYPSWSPDGTKIAFTNNDIHIINVDGTGLTNLTNGEGGDTPDWQ